MPVQTDLQFWKIYLDTCCLSRFFDPPTQARVRQEIEDISQIFAYCSRGYWHWFSSTVLSDEIEQTADLTKRSRIESLLAHAHQTILAGADIETRGQNLELLGFGRMDALHIACAEIGEVDILLTTDDKLVSRAERYQVQLSVRVENPSTWLQEVK